MSASGSVEAPECSSFDAPPIGSDAGAAPPQRNSWDHFNGRQRWMLVFVLFLIASSGAVDRGIIAILLEPIKREYHLSDTALGLLTGVAFGIFYAILGLPIARYADRGDRRLLISVSVGLWSLFTAACGWSRSFLQLFLLRIGVAVGEAGGTGAPSLSLLADYFPPEKRARAVGVINMSTISGAVLGLIGGGVVNQYYGWRATFLAAGAPGVVLALIAWLALREPRAKSGAPIVSAGGESLTTALRALIRKPTFVNTALAYLTFNFLANGALVFSAAYTQRVLHVSTADAGLATGLPSTVGVLAGNVVGGLMADKLSQKDMAWLCRIPGYGMLLTFPFYVVAFLAPNLIGFTVLSAIAGTIMIGTLPPIVTTMLVVVGPTRRATGMMLSQLLSSLVGVTAGPIVTGMLSDLLSRSMGLAEGLRWALILSLFAFLPTAWFMLRAGRTIRADLEI